MSKVSQILLTGISVLLVLSITPFVFNDAFAGVPGNPRMPLPAVGPIGDFRCWQAGGASSGIGVDLRDQFGELLDVGIGPLREFCASADKRYNNQIFESPFRPGDQHFTGYIFFSPIEIKRQTHSAYIPQFDLLLDEVTVSRAVELLVPTTKYLENGEPSPSQTDLHYLCYVIDNQPDVKLPSFSLATQFGGEDFDETTYRAVFFCTPVVKDHSYWNPSTFGALIDEHLICFIDIVDDMHSISIDNQFTLGDRVEVNLGVRDKFCFEALKDYRPNVIGGAIIPIESTSLLLAGVQSFSWMIPVTLSILGIGLFVVFRKSQN